MGINLMQNITNSCVLKCMKITVENIEAMWRYQNRLIWRSNFTQCIHTVTSFSESIACFKLSSVVGCLQELLIRKSRVKLNTRTFLALKSPLWYASYFLILSSDDSLTKAAVRAPVRSWYFIPGIPVAMETVVGIVYHTKPPGMQYGTTGCSCPSLW